MQISTAPGQPIPRVDPGDTVIFKDGVYSRQELDILRGGQQGAPVTYKAEHSWKAIFDGESDVSQAINIDGGVGHVEIYGIQLTNYRAGGIGAGPAAHDIIYRNCLFHNIGRICTDTSGGLVGTRDKDDTLRVLYDRNVFHTIGRFHPGESGCNPDSGNWKNHDHGIYLRGQDAIVTGNVFYNFRSGWCIQVSNGSSGGQIVDNTFAYPNPNRDGHIVLWNRQSNMLIARNKSIDARGSFIDVTGSDPCGQKSNVLVEENQITAPRVLAIDCPSSRIQTRNNITSMQLDFMPPTGPLIPDSVIPPPPDDKVYDFQATGKLRVTSDEIVLTIDPVTIKR